MVWLLWALVTPVPARTANVEADPRFTGCRVGGGLGAAVRFAAARPRVTTAQRRNELSLFMCCDSSPVQVAVPLPKLRRQIYTAPPASPPGGAVYICLLNFG